MHKMYRQIRLHTVLPDKDYMSFWQFFAWSDDMHACKMMYYKSENNMYLYKWNINQYKINIYHFILYRQHQPSHGCCASLPKYCHYTGKYLRLSRAHSCNSHTWHMHLPLCAHLSQKTQRSRWDKTLHIIIVRSYKSCPSWQYNSIWLCLHRV